MKNCCYCIGPRQGVHKTAWHWGIIWLYKTLWRLGYDLHHCSSSVIHLIPAHFFHLSPCAGMRCQMCEDGYYGDPLGRSGVARPCARCDCNGNVDFNALGICDHITGRCLKCLGHTEGKHCQRCRRGFYGNALNQTVSQKCKRKRLKRDCGGTPANWYIMFMD